MASFLDKVKIKVAKNESTKLDLSCDHISTANFMQFNVAYTKEMVPGEKIDINMETFTRLAPMPVPTFGRARINNRAFFVPFRTIFPAWNDFITDSPHVMGSELGTGIVSHVPLISNNAFIVFFCDYGSTSLVTELTNTPGFSPATSRFDFNTYNSGEEQGNRNRYYNFTPRGRQLMKIFESLGYKVIWNRSSDFSHPLYSALPLLAIGKVYLDWYYNSQYYGTESSTNLEKYFKNDSSLSPTITESYLISLSTVIRRVNYDSDYFVSAWDNPSAPNTGTYSSFTMPDVTTSINNDAVYTSDSNGTPITTAGVSLSQYAIDALKGLTDYMKRHQLVGARALDRYLARFGITLSAEKLNRSIYIGTKNEDIKFGDVMSTADTDGANLGNYAGKGIGYSQGKFEFSTDEYGMIVIVSTIQPKAGYYQGINRNVMHAYKTDFWTPEFDNLGTQAIAKSELFVPTRIDNFTGTNSLNSGVFGWTPRYAEYKIGRDQITGDFRYNSINLGTDSWHTMRELNYTNSNNMVHNLAFVGGDDADQYDRIFYNTNSGDESEQQFVADKFNVIYHFDIASYSPMKPLYDTYEFEEKGKDITMDAGGVKMN